MKRHVQCAFKTTIVLIAVSYILIQPNSVVATPVKTKVQIMENYEENKDSNSMSIELESSVIYSETFKGRENQSTFLLRKEALLNNEGAADLPSIVSNTPSIIYLNENGSNMGSSTFRVRGNSPSRTAISLDGVPMNDPESHEVFWANIPNITSSLGSIEIQRGVGIGSLGSIGGFGSSLNLTLNSHPMGYGGAVVIGMGSFKNYILSANANVTIIKNRLSFLMGITKEGGDGYLERGSINHSSLFSSLQYKDQKRVLKLNFLGGVISDGITWQGTPKDSFNSRPRYNISGLYIDKDGKEAFYDKELSVYRQFHLHLHYKEYLNDKNSISSSLFWVKGNGYYDEYENIRGEDTNPESGVRDNIMRSALDNNLLGVIVRYNFRKNPYNFEVRAAWNSYYGNHFGDSREAIYGEPVTSFERIYSNKAVKTEFSLASLFTYKYRDSSDASSLLGIEIQYRNVQYNLTGEDDTGVPLNIRKGYNFVSPKFFITHKGFSLSLGYLQKEPNRSALKDGSFDGDNVKEEHLLDLELGYSLPFNRYVNGGVNIFAMGYYNQLVATGKLNSVGYSILENVKYSYRVGAEFTLNSEITRWFKIGVNATISMNQSISSPVVVDIYDNKVDYNFIGQRSETVKNTPLSYSPPVVIGGDIGFTPYEKRDVVWELHLKPVYVASQYVDNSGDREAKIPNYFTLNFNTTLSIRYWGERRISFSVAANNILNSKYYSNAWGYRSHFLQEGVTEMATGVYSQAGVNIFTTVRIVL